MTIIFSNPEMESFLSKKGILEQFKKNVIQSLERNRVGTERKLPEEFVVTSFISSFLWSATQDGADFWRNIASEYRTYLDSKS